MHAVVFHAPFDLRYEEVPTPTCPPGGILTKTLACGICGTDMRTYRGGSARAKYPGIFGHEIVAEVVESQYDAFPVGTRLSVDPIIRDLLVLQEGHPEPVQQPARDRRYGTVFRRIRRVYPL